MKTIQQPEKRAIGWNAYLNKKLIDTVFFDASCSKEYVLKALINHDGYDSRITIRK